MPEQISLVGLLAGVTTLSLAIFGTVLREHWRRTREHDDRIRALESHCARRQDIEGLHERINVLGAQMNSQHASLLQTILDVTKRWNA